MPIYKKKWFCEETVPGKRLGKIKHCFFIDKLIFKGKTSFQEVLVFKNPVFGRVFCLDDIIEFSEKDEFVYHEMIIHPVLFSHPDPKNVLIIGGGDGGTLREALKHPLKKIDLVEADKKVIDISKNYLKFVCQKSFSDKRAEVHIEPGEEFIKSYKNFYDVIIIDCTNASPKAISFPLYSEKFYKKVFLALKKEGIMITLGASFLDFENFIKKISKRLNRIFPYSAIYKFCMPSYHCGEYSFIAGSKKIDLKKVDFKKIESKFNKIEKKYNFKHYSPKIHKASMILPKRWQIK